MNDLIIANTIFNIIVLLVFLHKYVFYRISFEWRKGCYEYEFIVWWHSENLLTGSGKVLFKWPLFK